MRHFHKNVVTGWSNQKSSRNQMKLRKFTTLFIKNIIQNLERGAETLNGKKMRLVIRAYQFYFLLTVRIKKIIRQRASMSKQRPSLIIFSHAPNRICCNSFVHCIALMNSMFHSLALHQKVQCVAKRNKKTRFLFR